DPAVDVDEDRAITDRRCRDGQDPAGGIAYRVRHHRWEDGVTGLPWKVERFSGAADRSRALRAVRAGSAPDPDQLAEREDEAQVLPARPVFEGQGEVDAVRRPAAGGQRSTQPDPGRGLPARVGPEGRIARPDPADVEEERAADVEHVAERPAEVDPVLGGEEEPVAARVPEAVVAADAEVAAEGELVRGPRPPPVRGRRARDEGVPRRAAGPPVGDEFAVGEDVFPAVGAGGPEIVPGVAAQRPGHEEVAELGRGVARDRRVEVVAAAPPRERASGRDLELGPERDVLLAAHAVEPSPLDPRDLAPAGQEEQADGGGRVQLSADRGEGRLVGGDAAVVVVAVDPLDRGLAAGVAQLAIAE